MLLLVFSFLFYFYYDDDDICATGHQNTFTLHNIFILCPLTANAWNNDTFIRRQGGHKPFQTMEEHSCITTHTESIPCHLNLHGGVDTIDHGLAVRTYKQIVGDT